jgi:N-acylneuraminate cytidylyltransferase
MKIVSVILARGGSKSIPKKNIVIVKDKPMIYYTIMSSINSNVDSTWVCTDDLEISNISKENGAKVLMRPAELATDTSSSEDSLLFFASKISFDILVFIQPTSPLLKSKYINEAILLLKNNVYDSVFSVSLEHWVPRWTKDMQPINWDIDKRPRRQDKEDCFIENGAFYATRKKSLLKSKLRYSGRIGKVIMPYSEGFQVDSYDDLAIIEKLI